MMGVVPSRQQLREVARQLRLISKLTEHLPDDSAPDATLRDRLELAADLLAGAANPRSHSVESKVPSGP